MTTIVIHNCETNEVVEKAMTAKQIADNAAAFEEHQAGIAAARAAKQAVLDKLGLTTEELAAIIA